ncbi:MAG TPA: Xaa-Pro dipeptidase [Thermoanaerobaculia bacterium]|nr:Xaa-Pro dipeptidase [Thermoanaerobaculia bacterium]
MIQNLTQLYDDHLETVRRRHDRALEETGFDQLIVFGGAEHGIFLDDQPYPFKVNAHFKYWVPVLDNPNCFVVYTPGRKPLLLYFQPVDYWYKPAETPRELWVEHFDIRPIGSLADARKSLPANLERTAWIGEWDEQFADWGIEQRNPKALIDRLHYDRSWKTDYEIEAVREANRIAAGAHRAAEKAFRDGASEYEIHITYLQAAAHSEAQLPYPNIIALNENAAVLHYQHQERSRPAEIHSFLIDDGATAYGYASDITRTYSARSDEFQEMITAFDAMQQTLVDEVRPGLNYPDLHLLTHRRIGEILGRFDFVRDLDPETMTAKGITSTFFPHGVGHYLGLQVHDVAGFAADREGTTIPKPEGHPYLRLTRVVEPRQLFTVEPGLYFIDSLLADLHASENARYVNWDKLDRFRRYGGIRIEDNIVVREDGHENLTRPFL